MLWGKIALGRLPVDGLGCGKGFGGLSAGMAAEGWSGCEGCYMQSNAFFGNFAKQLIYNNARKR